MRKILLSNKRGKQSSNSIQKLNTQIDRDYRILPFEGASTRIDEYKQYLKEKKESNKYRLSFTVNPVCSNVLFNNISEIVYKEGSDECKCFGLDGEIIEGIVGVEDYLSYKGITVNNNTKLTRQDLVRDTGFTHPDIGPFVYHCGYDIFNNHTLRKKEFNVINKIKGGTDSVKRKNFNTISDYKRDNEGNIIKDIIPNNKINNNKETSGTKTLDSHLYQMSTILSFPDSISVNLVEENGWIGFINNATLDIPNYVHTMGTGKDKREYNISLNKTMNNNKHGEFYDMYPDRSLYSFIPKVNKYRNNRLEPNWDYCLTYPYENFYSNELVQYSYKDDKNNNVDINGLSCSLIIDEGEWTDSYGRKLFDMVDDDESDDILYTLKTKFTNNLEESSKIEVTVIGVVDGKITYETIDDIIRVESVDKRNNTFTINGSELRDTLYHFIGEETIKYSEGEEIVDVINLIDIRIRRVNAGVPCKYYFRKFKKINGGNINSVINKMGFSKNIYSDDVAQLLFNDDVNLDGLKDNLGRELSEIFLTIIKNNKGYQKWYYDKSYGSDDITFSHCFGEVTSGIEMIDTNDIDYNIHKLHNVPSKLLKTKYNETFVEVSDDDKFLDEDIFVNENGEYRNPKTLEQNITLNGTHIDKDVFLGDIVEFSPSQVNETVLEDVKHRFNTVQREYYYKYVYNEETGIYEKKGEEDKEFYDLFIDEIHYDDYDMSIQNPTVSNNNDIKGNFELFPDLKYNILYNYDKDADDNTPTWLIEYPINIAPEGYFYKPHYRILLKEFRDTILQGKHEEIFTTYDSEKISGDDKGTVITSKTNVFSYLSVLGNGLDKLWLYDRYGVNDKIEATLTDVGLYPSTSFTIKIDKPISEVLEKAVFETEINGIVTNESELSSYGDGEMALIGKSFDIYVRGDIVRINNNEGGITNEIVDTLTNLNGAKVKNKSEYYLMVKGVITKLNGEKGREPEVYENLGERYRIYKPNITKPNNSIELDDGTGRYLWRELKEEHEYETERGEVSEYVFTNGAHYINKNINFFLRRQDPDGIYELSNDDIGIGILSSLTVDGYSVDNSGIEHYEIDEEGFVC